MHVTKKGDNERWFRGYGPDQYVYYARQGPKKYLGGAFEVESREELEKVLKVPGATVLSDGIEEMKDAPGGGYIVTIADPEGFPVNFIWGQEPVREERKKPEKLLFNDEDEKPRQKAFQRFEPGPAEVHKVSNKPQPLTHCFSMLSSQFFPCCSSQCFQYFSCCGIQADQCVFLFV